jgi:ribosomal protein S27AE
LDSSLQNSSKYYRLILRTTVKIEKGSKIYSTYIKTQIPTLLRRELLKKSKFFDCSCSRCSDPTELGTHMSSLKCNKCDPGLITSSDPLGKHTQSLSLRILDPDEHFKINSCLILLACERRIFHV